MFLNLFCSHCVHNPLYEYCNTGVDAVHVWAGASFAPAHYASQKPCVVVAGNQWPAAVPLTGVTSSCLKASAQHVFGQAQARVGLALLQRHPGHLQPLEQAGLRSVLRKPAPATHDGGVHHAEHANKCPLCWRNADGHDIGAERYVPAQVQKRYVGISGRVVVERMDYYFGHLFMLLCAINLRKAVFTCGEYEYRKGSKSKEQNESLIYCL